MTVWAFLKCSSCCWTDGRLLPSCTTIFGLNRLTTGKVLGQFDWVLLLVCFTSNTCLSCLDCGKLGENRTSNNLMLMHSNDSQPFKDKFRFCRDMDFIRLNILHVRQTNQGFANKMPHFKTPRHSYCYYIVITLSYFGVLSFIRNFEFLLIRKTWQLSESTMRPEVSHNAFLMVATRWWEKSFPNAVIFWSKLTCWYDEAISLY